MRATAPIVLVFLLAVVAARADEGESTRIPLPHPVADETDWYGVYQGRDKVGWALVQLRGVGEGEAARYESRSRIEATLSGMGQRLEFSLDATDVFRGSFPFELLTSRETRKDGDLVRTIALDRQADGRYLVVQTEGEDSQTVHFDDLAYTLADRLCHIHWAMAGPAVGDRLHAREFEITDLRHDVYGYEMKAVRERSARGLRIRVYDIAMHSHRQGGLGTQVVDSDGRMLSGPLAGVAELRLESPAQAREERFASDLFAFGRVPTTEKIGVARTVRRLELAVYGRGRDRFLPGPAQAVRETDDGDTLLLLGEDAGPGDPPTAAEVEQALQATETYPSDREDVQALARRAARGGATPREQVARLVDFVAGHVEDLNLPSEYPVARLLEEPKGDSTEHARLFVALARALGIPAREVRGLVYLGDDEMAFGGHAWAEVAVDGRWQPVDPTWNQQTPDATHVAFARGSDAWVAMLAITRRLTFEIRSVEHGR